MHTRRFFLGLIGHFGGLAAAGVSRAEPRPACPETPEKEFSPQEPPRGVRPERLELARFHVAGFRFYDGPALLPQLASGNPVNLIPEPENPHDSGAVRLEWRGKMLGYLPRNINPVIGRLLAQQTQLDSEIVSTSLEAQPWLALEVAIYFDAGQRV